MVFTPPKLHGMRATGIVDVFFCQAWFACGNNCNSAEVVKVVTVPAIYSLTEHILDEIFESCFVSGRVSPIWNNKYRTHPNQNIVYPENTGGCKYVKKSTLASKLDLLGASFELPGNTAATTPKAMILHDKP